MTDDIAELLAHPEWIEAAEQRRQAKDAVRSLSSFVRMIWPVIEPGVDLEWNWHLDVMADELEAVTRGDTRELVICVPPGSMKSIMVSVAWPTWEWLLRPYLRGLYVSNSDDLAKRDSRRARDIIQSEEYRACQRVASEDFGVEPWELSRDQAEKHHFANTQHGFRQALPMGANITGKRGDKLVIDDPLDAQDAVVGTPEQVQKRMEDVQHKYDHVLASRLNAPRWNPRVTIMQRLAPNDLAGVLMDRGVRAVVLPMEYDPEHPQRHPDDPRTEPGELLFPARFDRQYIDEQKEKPGASRHYESQYQQRPQPLGGGVFRAEWFRYYEDRGEYYLLHEQGRGRRLLKRDCWRVMTADTALTERSMSDFTVIQVWDVERIFSSGESDELVPERGGAMVLVDQWRGQVEAPGVEDKLKEMMGRYKPVYVAVEDSSASKPILQRFKRDGIAVKPMRPRDYGGDKVARAYTASIWMEAGRMWFPQESAWLGELERELLTFPSGEHDDQCLVPGTMVATERGEVPIEQMDCGDRVLTRSGYRRVLASRQTKVAAEVVRAEFSDGRVLIGTPNHPVFCADHGWVNMDSLSYGDKIIAWHGNDTENRNQSGSTALSSAGIPKQKARPIAGTIARMAGMLRGASSTSTKRSGSTTTDRYPKATRSITSTATPSTTIFPTLLVSLSPSIVENMATAGIFSRRSSRSTWRQYVLSLLRGIVRRRDGRGIAATPRSRGKSGSQSRLHAHGAERNTKPRSRVRGKTTSALQVVARAIGGIVASTTKAARVSDAASHSSATDTRSRDFAVAVVRSVRRLPDPYPVYNLTVEGEGEYFANGILVHNCDTLAYAAIFCSNRNLWERPKAPELPPGSLGKLLGMEEIFRPKREPESPFAMDN